VLLLVLAGLRVLVAEDEVDLDLSVFQLTIGYAEQTLLVRTEHDNVRRSIGELLAVQLLVLLEELHIGTTTLKAI
jgi:hypothetical protein